MSCQIIVQILGVDIVDVLDWNGAVCEANEFLCDLVVNKILISSQTIPPLLSSRFAQASATSITFSLSTRA